MRRAGKGAIVLFAALCLASPVLAATDQERAAARATAEAGLAAYQDEDFLRAIDALQRAEAIMHAPTHLLYIARSRARLGLLVEASETYEKIVNENLPETASEAFLASQVAAKSELDEVHARIPKLTVLVKTADASPLYGLRITIDGAPLGDSLVGAALPLNPGKHVVRSQAAGKLPFETNVVLTEAEVRQIIVTLQADPALLAPAATAAAQKPARAQGPAPPVTAQDTGSGTKRTLGWVGIGLGAALVGTGAALGVLSVNQSEAARSDPSLCPSFQCSPQGRGQIDDAFTKALVADVSVGVGILAAAVGTYLVLTSGEQEAPPARADRARSVAPTLVPLVGAWGGGLAVVGSFE